MQSVPENYSVEAAAKRLQRARRLAGFAQPSDAVEALGFTASTYFGHENGHRGFKPADALRYAKAFRVSAGWLYFGTDSEAPLNSDPQPSASVEPGWEEDQAPDQALILAHWHLARGKVDLARTAAKHFLGLTEPARASAAKGGKSPTTDKQVDPV